MKLYKKKFKTSNPFFVPSSVLKPQYPTIPLDTISPFRLATVAKSHFRNTFRTTLNKNAILP